jgi:hypothetical protein
MTLFREATVSGEGISFEGATFSGKWAIFTQANFGGDHTIFSRAEFSTGKSTSFTGTLFGSQTTHFAGTEFRSAETFFTAATFHSKLVFFCETLFKETVTFLGAEFASTKRKAEADSGPWVLFSRCRIDKPELLTFRDVSLHPGWFVETEISRVDFARVRWYGLPGGPKGKLNDELAAIMEQGRWLISPNALLAETCQQLAANAEDNREYLLANEFHYWSMDALRKESWEYLTRLRKNWLRVKRRCGLVTTLRWAWRVINRRRLSRPRSRFGIVTTLYWALSGYGVRAARAFWVLVGIWAAFTILYILVPASPFSGFSISDFGDAIVYSLGAIARLNPEPRPDEPGLFQLLVTVEEILGPLQIALLALAVRRKVMR